MSDLLIRVYAESDREAVVEIWDAAFAEDPPRNAPQLVIDRKQGVQPELFLVAIHRGRLVGTVLGGYDGFRGWAYHLAVHPEHRHRGFGRRLVESLEQRLRELGCAKLNLQIRAGNRGVRAFYERLGYDVEERVAMGKVLE